MSDTPKTDTLSDDLAFCTQHDAMFKMTKHARSLERELNQMHKRYRVLKEAIRKLQDTTVGI